MRRPASKIREEIARLQDQLKAAETREAERIGRIVLKAGLGEIDIDDDDLLAAFEDLVMRFRGKSEHEISGRDADHSTISPRTSTAKVETGAAADGDPEA